MDVNFKPETALRLRELAAETGRSTDELAEDALAGYFAELSQVREKLETRYDDLQSGRVKPIDGEQAFESLRQRSLDRRRRA